MDITSHPQFRYMPGMLALGGPRVLSVFDADGEQHVTYAYARAAGYGAGPDVTHCRAAEFCKAHAGLDLADAATQGCLLSLLITERALITLGTTWPTDDTVRVDLDVKFFADVPPITGQPASLGESIATSLLTAWSIKESK